MSGDLTHLASQLTDCLVPIAPLLFKAGEGAAETAGGQLGSGVADGVKKIWARLRPTVDADPRARAAVVELSAAPEDEDLQAQFRVQLRRLLQIDDELAGSLSGLLSAAPEPGGFIMAEEVIGIHNVGGSNTGQQIGFVLGEVNRDQRGMPRR